MDGAKIQVHYIRNFSAKLLIYHNHMIMYVEKLCIGFGAWKTQRLNPHVEPDEPVSHNTTRLILYFVPCLA
jgi:hypothetical protein